MKKIAVILMAIIIMAATACSTVSISGGASTNPWDPSMVASTTVPHRTPRITPSEPLFEMPSEPPIDIPAHTPIDAPAPEHFYVRAWKEFLHVYNTSEVINERYVFADLDDDGEDEMIAYMEIHSEDEYGSAPYMTIFDYEDGAEFSVPVKLGIGFHYYTRIYLSALNRIVVEDNALEGYFSYNIFTYANGKVSVTTEERNGHEPDIEKWEMKNKLVRPWADDNPDHPFRYIGLGHLYYESYDPESGEDSVVGKLVDDSAKMAAYQQR